MINRLLTCFSLLLTTDAFAGDKYHVYFGCYTTPASGSKGIQVSEFNAGTGFGLEAAELTSAACDGHRNSSVKNDIACSPRNARCTSSCGLASVSVAYINDVRTITAVGQAAITAASASAFITPYSVIACG